VYLNSIYTYNEKPTSGKEETKEGSVNSNIWERTMGSMFLSFKCYNGVRFDY